MNKRKYSSIYAILARFVLHNYTDWLYDYAFQSRMRADANLARLRPSGAPILNIRRTAPKRLPEFSCASSDSQVRTGGCSPTLLRMFRTGRAETAVCNCFSKPLPLYCYAYLCKNVAVAGLSFPTICKRMNNKGFFTCLCPTISFLISNAKTRRRRRFACTILQGTNSFFCRTQRHRDTEDFIGSD